MKNIRTVPPAVTVAAKIHKRLGRTLAWRESRVCLWLPVAVKDTSGNWIGQITLLGDFVPNVTERERRRKALEELAEIDAELI